MPTTAWPDGERLALGRLFRQVRDDAGVSIEDEFEYEVVNGAGERITTIAGLELNDPIEDPEEDIEPTYPLVTVNVSLPYRTVYVSLTTNDPDQEPDSTDVAKACEAARAAAGRLTR